MPNTVSNDSFQSRHTMSTYPTVQEELACVDWSEPYDGRSEYDGEVFVGDYGKGMKRYQRVVITDNPRSEQQKKYLVAVDLPSEEELVTIRKFCPCPVCRDRRDRADARWYELRYWFSVDAWECRGCHSCIEQLGVGDYDSRALDRILDARVLIKRNNKPK